MSMNHAEFLDEQIKMTRVALLAAMEKEIDILSGAIQSYTLDTGQSRQTITKLNITELRKYIDDLQLRLQRFENMKNPPVPTYARGVW